MKNITVKDIVERYLIENGYDGLTCDFCSCIVGDVMPCMTENVFSCEPGYKIKCSGCGDYDYCISTDKNNLCDKVCEEEI